MRKVYANNPPRPCPFLGKTCTILRGPNRDCTDKVIEYNRLANEFTIAVYLSDDRVVWVWEPRHNTDLINLKKPKNANF